MSLADMATRSFRDYEESSHCGLVLDIGRTVDWVLRKEDVTQEFTIGGKKAFCVFDEEGKVALVRRINECSIGILAVEGTGLELTDCWNGRAYAQPHGMIWLYKESRSRLAREMYNHFDNELKGIRE